MTVFSFNPTGLQALVVDDEVNVRLLARSALEMIGFDVEEAADGAAALALLDKLRPDIIVLDVVMPRLDGFAVCSTLRARPWLEHIPVIMLTGLEDLGSITRAYEVGATDFMTKPVNWEIFKHRARYAVRASIAFRGLANAQRIARMGNWEWSTDDDRVTCSDEVYRILGRPRGADPLLYTAFIGCVDPEDRARIECVRRAALEEATPYDVTYRLRVASGEHRSVQEHGEAIRPANGRNARLRGTLQDITERREFEDQITFMAHHDSLTGLPNRRCVEERLEKAIANAARDDTLVGILFFDLDRFKSVNDTFGHSIGDQALRAVGSRVGRCIRGTDIVARGNGQGPTIARLGGDEFIVLLESISSPEDAAVVAHRILHALSRPFRLGGTDLLLTPSIGVTVYPRDGDCVEVLLQNVDIAMYHAKRQGRNNCQFFTDELSARSQRRLSLETELVNALDRDEYRLHYQPIFDLATERICGVEALLRWNNRVHGSVPPADFIRIAEELGLIVPIGEWVLRTACAQCKKWANSGFGPVRIAVNISAAQLRHENLARTIGSILADVGLPPRQLQLELTESVLMDNSAASAQVLVDLRQMGVAIAIDDFGTGYSSLSYLQRFGFDSLKIDRSFIRDAGDQGNSRSIVSAIIAMAHKLDLKVVAEGVERPEQLAFLRRKRCEAVQGFLLARPGSARAVESIWHDPDSIWPSGLKDPAGLAAA